ncbi:MAG: hypothetical protein ABI036_03005 [Fibrobacteria bacterium]
MAKARTAIRDLRVYLDFDEDSATFAAWPLDKFGRKLAADQIARGVRLGLSLWASVLPEMHFRFVNRAEDANLCFRFGPYARSGILPDGARAFFPDEWANLDAECGRRQENKYPDGKPCREWEHNVIIMHTGRWAVRAADFMGNDRVYRDFAWIYDPVRPHYRKDGGPCRDGNAPGTAWSDACVTFRASPWFNALGGVDLPATVEHEFGHALMGWHSPSPYECVDYARRPILSRDSCVRLSRGGFSVMFPGDGVDAWWNRRGVFAADVARLKGLGYHTSYPRTGAVLVLKRPGKGFLRTSDWGEAVRAMIWPLQTSELSPGQARRQLFLVDVELPGAAGTGLGGN